MMLTDIVLAFPILLLAISLTSLLGASLLSCILGVSLAGWAVWTRMARGMIISTREKEYVQAARVMGVRGMKLTFQYILPDLWPSIITATCLHAGTLLVLISGLSFLGFGSGPQHPELGSMMRDARMYLTTAPWVLFGPGFMIIWCVSGFYVLGAGLRKHFQIRDRFNW
jgi:ABC-type dipeptide/oligopeptide/nickel transport system permease subunit